MTTILPEWTAYGATLPPPERGTVYALDRVRTVMHVQEAQRAIDDGMIAARLVNDESKLNTSRLPVVWTSANSWSIGSMYGSVEFVFPWHDLVAGKQFYWVEAITDYKPPAYRLLVAKSGTKLPSKIIEPYDPARDEGPIRFDGAQWYWNGSATSEVMFAEDLSLDRLEKVGFTRHHPNLCRYKGAQCRERMCSPFENRGRVLAHILAKGSHSVDRHLTPLRFDDSGRNFDFHEALQHPWLVLTSQAGKGEAVTDPDEAEVVMRGALALYAMGQTEAAVEISGVIAKKNLRKEALANIIREHFDADGWEYE